MEYVHFQIKAMPYNNLEIVLNRKANILVFNKINYHRYKTGKSYSTSLEFPDSGSRTINVPYKGEWHIIIAHGSFQGEIKARLDVV